MEVSKEGEEDDLLPLVAPTVSPVFFTFSFRIFFFAFKGKKFMIKKDPLSHESGEKVVPLMAVRVMKNSKNVYICQDGSAFLKSIYAGLRWVGRAPRKGRRRNKKQPHPNNTRGRVLGVI